MVSGSKSLKNNIKLNEEEMQTVAQFVYPENLLSAGGYEKEIKRIALTCSALAAFEKVWGLVCLDINAKLITVMKTVMFGTIDGAK